jgi:hypothetical protein
MESASTPPAGGGTLVETSGYDKLTASTPSTARVQSSRIEVGMADNSNMTPADTWIVL